MRLARIGAIFKKQISDPCLVNELQSPMSRFVGSRDNKDLASSSVTSEFSGLLDDILIKKQIYSEKRKRQILLRFGRAF